MTAIDNQVHAVFGVLPSNITSWSSLQVLCLCRLHLLPGHQGGQGYPCHKKDFFCGRAGGNQRYSIRVLADLKIYDNMLLVGGQQFTGFKKGDP